MLAECTPSDTEHLRRIHLTAGSVLPVTRTGSAADDALKLAFGPITQQEFSPELSHEEMIVSSSPP